MWGIAMPVAGALADRYSARTVMVTGALMVSPPRPSPRSRTPPARSSSSSAYRRDRAPAPWARASSCRPRALGAGGKEERRHRHRQRPVVPSANSPSSRSPACSSAHRWQPAMVIMGVVSLGAIPAILWVTQAHPAPSAAGAHTHGQRDPLAQEAVGTAFRDPSFLLLTVGLSSPAASTSPSSHPPPRRRRALRPPHGCQRLALALIGLFNIFGSLWVGKFVSSRRMKTTLAGIYFARGLIILIFFFSPKTTLTFLLFAAAIGFSYSPPVSATIGLVIKFYGPRLRRDAGSAWSCSPTRWAGLPSLAAKPSKQTGSYDWMWFADIALCLFAAAIHLPIAEAKPAPLRAAAA